MKILCEIIWWEKWSSIYFKKHSKTRSSEQYVGSNAGRHFRIWTGVKYPELWEKRPELWGELSLVLRSPLTKLTALKSRHCLDWQHAAHRLSFEHCQLLFPHENQWMRGDSLEFDASNVIRVWASLRVETVKVLQLLAAPETRSRLRIRWKR